MPGSEAATTDPASEVIDTIAAESLPEITESKLENDWNQLVRDVRSAKLETDLDERFSRTNFERAVELALRNPASMSISTEPRGRRLDMTSHVREHFDNLLNDDDWAPRLKTARPDAERLLKACVLAYLYDAVYRFSSTTVIHPDIDGLEDVTFVEVSADLCEWMGEVDLIWLTLANELAPEERVTEWIDRVYEEREAFVETAKEKEIFLPISGEYRDDPGTVESMVRHRLARGAHVSPRLIHNYCFTEAVEQFE